MSARKGKTEVPAAVIEQAAGLARGFVLAKVLEDALARGYVVQMTPGGDPHVWRQLADAMWAVIGEMDGGSWSRQPAKWRHAATVVRDRYTEALAAYTVQPPSESQPKGTPE